jgi:predicted nucleic acid-binding protein
MSIDAVVIDASPLITLFRSGQSELLPGLFSRIIVPEAVWQEVVCNQSDTAARKIPGMSWLIREQVQTSSRVEVWNLGRGETAVLSYALAHPPLRAVIDDYDARRTAHALGVPVIGTVGLLVLAKRRGLISSVSNSLDKLRAAGLWLSDDLVRNIKVQAGERDSAAL